jgi:hypothetical protein
VSAPSLLASLAAAMAPGLAARSLGRDPDPALAAEAARLASLPRIDRLAALETALAARPRPVPDIREAVAAAERPRVAALVRNGAEGCAAGTFLSRLILERAWCGR